MSSYQEAKAGYIAHHAPKFAQVESKIWIFLYKWIITIYSQHPLEASVVGFINALQVVEGDGMTKELFVEWKSESAIDVEPVKHSHAQHTTNKVEVW